MHHKQLSSAVMKLGTGADSGPGVLMISIAAMFH